jgi:predicted transcriptional regulator
MVSIFPQRRTEDSEVSQSFALGPLEHSVMQVVWEIGSCSVRDVVKHLDRDLAYTTVMTTMDRLYKKGLLDRAKCDRAFLYFAHVSQDSWERQRTDDLLAGFLSGTQPSREMLLSCLVDAVGEHDPDLLDELEAKIQSKRRALSGDQK